MHLSRAPKYVKQKYTKSKREIIDKQKQNDQTKFSKDIKDSKITTSQLHLESLQANNTFRILHPIKVECIFYTSIQQMGTTPDYPQQKGE